MSSRVNRRHAIGLGLALPFAARTQHAGAFGLPGWLTFWEDDYAFHGGVYDPPKPSQGFGDAKDQHGNAFNVEAYAGKVLFLYFGYTHCPDACPTTLSEWKEVKAALGDDVSNVVFAMVTVDPKRDTPELIGKYVEFWDPSFLGVSMSDASTKTVTRDWGIQYSYEDSDSAGGYLVNHDVSTYVVDPKGMLRLTYPLGMDPAQIAEDVHHLLKGD